MLSKDHKTIRWDDEYENTYNVTLRYSFIEF